MLATLLFLFLCCGCPRDLLPFPTRRSSDLSVARLINEPKRIRLFERFAARMPAKRSKRRIRSEEHTSELQSHSDLVCRLLLEKKKQARERALAGKHESPVYVIEKAGQACPA